MTLSSDYEQTVVKPKESKERGFKVKRSTGSLTGKIYGSDLCFIGIMVICFYLTFNDQWLPGNPEIETDKISD